MKYIYQDSTELPVQRDFIEDLKTFLDITSRVIPLENSIIEIKCKHKEALNELNSRIHGMNNFEEKLDILLRKLVNEIDIEDVIPCANAIQQTCSENLGKKREVLEAEYTKIEKGTSHEYKKFEGKILEVLTRFLISGVYGAEKRFELSSTVDGISGEMEGSVSGLQYQYRLGFTEEVLDSRKASWKLEPARLDTDRYPAKRRKNKNAGSFRVSCKLSGIRQPEKRPHNP